MSITKKSSYIPMSYERVKLYIFLFIECLWTHFQDNRPNEGCTGYRFKFQK